MHAAKPLAAMRAALVSVLAARATGALVSSGALIEALAARVQEVNSLAPLRGEALVPFTVDGTKLGELRQGFADELSAHPDVFHVAPDGVRLVSHLETAPVEARTAAVATVATALASKGVLHGWRDELLAVRSSYDAAPALLVERALVPSLGVRGFGVFVNGWSVCPDTGDRMMWVATRSTTKPTWPGMLDVIAAGADSECLTRR